MRILVLLVLTVVSSISLAADRKTTYQTLPGSSTRDYSAPAYVTKGNTTYKTLPGSTTRDDSAPTYVTKGNTTYQTLPGSSTRDYSAASYVTGKTKK
jgi:hypothetical protein